MPFWHPHPGLLRLSGEPLPPLLGPGLPTMASIAQGAEVGVVIGPAVIERDQMIDMGFASAHRSPALPATHRVTEQDPRPSGSPIGGVVVPDFLGRRRAGHPLWTPGGDRAWHGYFQVPPTLTLGWPSRHVPPTLM